MSKVKVITHNIVEEETKYDYPVYLYFQDEDCLDEYIKVCENYIIRVKQNHFGFTIEKDKLFRMEKHYLEKFQTSEMYFDQAISNAINEIIYLNENNN